MAERRILNIGMIGAGFMAQVAHLHALSRIEDVRVVALSEPDAFLRTAVAARFGVAATHDDHRELLARENLDAVVVSTPRGAQPLVLGHALARGIPVLSEKPPARSLAEAEALAATARDSGAAWTVGFMRRHDAGVRRFKAELDAVHASGRLGPVLDVAMVDFCGDYAVTPPEHIRPRRGAEARYPQAPEPAVPLAERWREAFGYTLNVASHDIDLLRMLFGDGLTVVAFHAAASGAQRALFDAGGFPVSLAVGPARLGRWEQRIDVIFARGRLGLALPSPLARAESGIVTLESAEGVETLASDGGHVWAFEAQIRAFLDAVRDRARPDACAMDSLADMALIEILWSRMEAT